MTLGITGATGQLGRLVIEQLKTRLPADHIVALARNVEKTAELGVPSRFADYDAPASLTTAFSGLDTLLLISANAIGRRVVQHQNVIEAAKQAGVKHIVYTSLLHADSSNLSLAEEHRQTENILRTSGIAWTFLRNGWYTENYTSSIPGAILHGAFLGSAGNGRIASAARSDYAEAATIVLTQGEHTGKTYELAGDSSYTLTELAAELSRQTGKPIPYKDLPENEYAKVLASSGIPLGFAQSIAGWDVSASTGALFDDKHQLSQLLGHSTTPLSTTLAKTLTQLHE